MNKIVVPAKIENLQKVLNFINQELESVEYNKTLLLQLELSIEEAYVNIVNYAYELEDGDVLISCSIDKNPTKVTIQFIDSGIPYNPLDNEDPDTLSKIEDKEIGGLGIFLIKKNVDFVEYEYQGGKNILTLKKALED
jgi:anti-sigma regulatory factor (Ser/Thr protein kinase)